MNDRRLLGREAEGEGGGVELKIGRRNFETIWIVGTSPPGTAAARLRRVVIDEAVGGRAGNVMVAEEGTEVAGTAGGGQFVLLESKEAAK